VTHNDLIAAGKPVGGNAAEPAAGRHKEAGAAGMVNRRWSRLVPAAIVVAGLALLYAFGLQDFLSLGALAEHRDTLRGFVSDNAATAALAYFLAYALAVAVAFPAASVLTVFGGFLFGWLAGGALTVLAATLGATALFLAARTALSSVLRRRAGGGLARFREGFRRDAFSYLLVLRLAPVFPFFLVNIAPAFFDVRLRAFVAATVLGILPGTFAYAYLGSGLDSVLMAAARAGHDLSPADLVTPEITVAFALLAAAAALPILVRRLMRERGG
jgi:uncharacterized membrane protein YdjX (TVP38/TMEM64 family)